MMAALVLAGLAAWAGAQAGGPSGGLEGPLQNDAFVPVAAESARLLAAGDAELGALRPEVLAGARAPNEAERRAALAAFARWSQAAVAAGADEVVPLDLSPWLAADGFRWPDPEGSFPRRHEALEYALLSRLERMPEPLLALWREREATAASTALAAAHANAAALVRVERRHPGTRPAALAALRLFELELERGRDAVGRSWLARAAWHARLARDPEVSAGVARREASLWSQAPAPLPAPAWQRAEGLRAVGEPLSIPLPSAGGRRPPANPGLAFLPRGGLALQLASVVWIVAGDGGERGFEPGRLVRAAGLEPTGAVVGPDAPWRETPVADEELLYLIEGRAGPYPFGERPAGAAGRWHSNLLAAVGPSAGEALPQLVWCLGPDFHARPDGARRPLADVLGAGLWEFQPGPVRAGSLLVVQARRWPVELQEGELEVALPGEAAVWILALDARTGDPVWARELGRGTDLVPDRGQRFRRQYMVRTAAQPLVVAGGRIFVGTNLGLGALLDLADGRLVWSFLNRRRTAEEPGWRLAGGAVLTSWKEDGRRLQAVLWAPADSDRLYALRLEPEAGGRGLLLGPPQPIDEAEELVGGDPGRYVVLGRSGARRTLSAIEPESGRRSDSIYLGLEERFLSGALAGPRRVLAASDQGLYLFDLERDLYLMQHLPLELDARIPGSGLHARGDELWLIADRKLWRFAVD